MFFTVQEIDVEYSFSIVNKIRAFEFKTVIPPLHAAKVMETLINKDFEADGGCWKNGLAS
ncbi:hypothetical protein [Francisella salina]|uniref:Uncharacterized protein n=1 Tax=Francisella salina TaxID=573569 RepID=A0ABM5M781_FRAST|nr:hypothetical protein [Francisella salina]AEI35048.1 hypothetical protein F7308_0120 [Francisella salina]